MAWTSKLYPGEIFVDHSTHEDLTHPKEYGRGYISTPAGFASIAADFPDEWIVPPSEYQARIQEAEEKGERQSDRALAANLPCKDQAQTNFCFGNAPVHTLEYQRMRQNEEYVELSAASVAAPLSNFRNQGGSGTEAMSRIGEVGILPISIYPLNLVNGSRYFTDENLKIAAKYRHTKWIRIETQAQKFSYLLRRMGIASSGWPWWSHETSDYDVVWFDGEPAVRNRNSWGMDYGHKGFFIIRGSRLNFDECIAPIDAIASV